jgi:hypothetical protein
MRNQIVMSLRFPVSLTLLTLVITILTSAAVCESADPVDFLPGGGQHRLFNSDMPPGAIGGARLMGRGPVAGYFQPVAFSGPEGTKFTLPQNETFGDADASLQAGLLVGAIYRFRITEIPRAPGAELYPTVEVIDRTYPPPGMAHRYPIPINLDQEDLEAALDGRMVTRVVLLEDPQTAIAVSTQPTSSRAIDVAEYQDALEVADRFGRPVAIVRIGSVTPPRTPELMPRFYFGFPAWVPVMGPQPQTHVEPSVQP